MSLSTSAVFDEGLENNQMENESHLFITVSPLNLVTLVVSVVVWSCNLGAVVLTSNTQCVLLSVHVQSHNSHGRRLSWPLSPLSTNLDSLPRLNSAPQKINKSSHYALW